MRLVRLFLYSKQASRKFSSSPAGRITFSPGPAPPRLPRAEQDLYEELQRSSNGAFSTPSTYFTDPASKTSEHSLQRSAPQINQSPHTQSNTTPPTVEKVAEVTAKIQTSENGEELHPDIRRGARPEFEGERNPRTGEVGGPKNEPLRWGGEVDWSYNGRVTDF